MNSVFEGFRPQLSVIVPCFNEAGVLPALYARLSAVLIGELADTEILFVNDGSSDDTHEVLAGLAALDARIGRIDLSRNFGKEPALSAGMDHARGEAAIFIDADLQDPPECIPEMVAAWKNGYDVVAMRRADRSVDSPARRGLAKLHYRLLSALSEIEIPRDVGDFRLLSRRALDAVRAMPERNRYTKGLFAWVGYRTIELDYVRESRHDGESKWPFFKLLRLAIDGLTSFSIAPLRIASIAGLITSLFAVSYGLFVLIRTLLVGDSVAGFPTLLVMIAFIGGVQLMAIGLLGEYVGRLLIESKRRPIYFVEGVHLPFTGGASGGQFSRERGVLEAGV